MNTEVVQAVAQYAEELLGLEGFRYVCAVVANCKMLALELEARDETVTLDTDVLVIAAYLHDISTVVHGFQDHQVQSAAMAVKFLQELDVSPERI
ncbi:MAG TPA: HD domain-containing protein, partial [Ktedonobacteraceae bacterium]|nr:HD domain-containing protein [Ktedonobacteraceae bacterium]